MAAQVPPGEHDAAHAAPPTRATVQAQSAESRLHPHSDPSDAVSTTDAVTTKSRDSGTSGTTPPPATRPGPTFSRPGPNADNMHTEPDNHVAGNSHSPCTLAARDREIMPPPPPRPPHVGDHLDLEELRRAYDIYHRTPSPNLVDALGMHFQGVRGDLRFVSALLPHGATNICVRQLQALLTLGQCTPDDLIDVWVWSFNYHNPDRGQVWVPHLAWAQTLIPPLTEPRPAPRPGGRTRAVPQLSADVPNIPPYGGLAYWESRTTRERGQNIQTTERYAQTAGPGAHAEPPPRDTPSTVAMVVLESGHYYQSRSTPRPLENHWHLEAAEAVLPRDVDLPDGPTPHNSGQPPTPYQPSCLAQPAHGTQETPSTGCGDGPNGGGRIPGIGQRHGGSTWMAGNKRKPSHPISGRPGGQPRTTWALSLRSTRSGRRRQDTS